MFKSFVLGLYASGHSLHVRVTQTFAVNRFRTGAIYSMHSKTTHRLSFLKDDAKVLLILQNMGSVSDLMFLNKFTTRARVVNAIKVHTALPFF